MYCRTDTSLLYWSRGEASFFGSSFLDEDWNWMMLTWDKVLELWSPVFYHWGLLIWCIWV